LQIPVNAGSIDMLSQLGEVSPGHRVWLRVNPGFGHGHSQKTNTGGENSKHGIWYSHLPAALEVMRRYQLQLVGIHMHIGSGVDYGHLEQVCGAMVRQVVDFGQDLQAISAGGGLSIPYREGEEA
ncbi:diaminopimelate decarboxylase, partial [Pseudomonas aeruginosa]|nr:diaminopimelate decarboxylase [Pseudomonas aeruginosa]